MSNLKLGVEVIGAYGLFQRDKPTSCSPFVELKFDNQIFLTTTKPNDPNPVWNECFYFVVSDPSVLSNCTLEAHVYSQQNESDDKPFLGKVRVNGTSFVPRSEAAPFNYPVEKRSVFSRARGELGLRVFITDDVFITPSAPTSVPESPQAYSQSPRNEPVKSIRTADERIELKPKRRTFYNVAPSEKQQPMPMMNYGINEMRGGPMPPRVVQVNGPGPSSYQLPSDFSVKETSPFLGGGQIVGGRLVRGTKRPASSTYDLVEEMEFLYVRVVKARDLPNKDITGSLDPYVQVKIGNFKGVTTHLDKNSEPEWNQVFAFASDNLQSNTLEVVVKDKDIVLDDFVGLVKFDLREVQLRVPPDSPLAPEWYRLENKKGEKKKSEIMLAVWRGTQADEAFGDAIFSDSLASSDSSNILPANLRSKVYHSPRLWYLRVRILQAQDVIVSDKSRLPEAFVRIQMGNQMLKTGVSQRSNHPKWGEEFMLVVAEPFEDPLIFSVEDRSAPSKDEPIGRAVIQLAKIEKRMDDKSLRPTWVHLEESISDAMDEDKAKKVKFATRLQFVTVLEGGYHVFDDSTYYSGDLRPSARPLWKPAIGVLELGILSANGLHPMKTRDGKGTSDTYVVARYGHKWVRSRTVINNLNPKYNEQYTWEVFDPATVLTICVFDNAHFAVGNGDTNRDQTIGKVRIRISTLQTGRVYTNAYPLLVLQPSGLKKRGELHLAVRFTCTSVSSMMINYTKPLLPKMHYIQPLTIHQQEKLKVEAFKIIVARLGRSEPPLKREVVEYMTDLSHTLFSMRRSKANFFRFTAMFSGLLSVWKWMELVCTWRTPVTTALVHVLYTMLVMFPEMILPTVFLYMAVIGLWNYRFKPRFPPHMDSKLSYADRVNDDELDEEFDNFPTIKPTDVVKMRYDRLRSIAGKIQLTVGDIASQGERVQALLSWRDPRATAIFITFCFITAMVLYITPFKLVALFSGYYFMRHPKLRHRMPSAPLNFFRRLPAMSDSLL